MNYSHHTRKTHIEFFSERYSAKFFVARLIDSANISNLFIGEFGVPKF